MDLNKLFRPTALPKFNPDFEFRDPDEATNNILEYLQEQSEIASRQFKTSRNLIIATIIIMGLQIFIAGVDIFQSNSKENTLIKLIETQSEQSETISRMSSSLLDLQNQVRILEQENEQLLKN